MRQALKLAAFGIILLLSKTEAYLSNADPSETQSSFVIIRFDSGEKAKSWYNSAEQKRFTEIRVKASKSHSFLVDGM